jgi:hypothetical protein
VPVPRLREVSLEVFLVSLCSVSGSELRFFGVLDRYMQIREQRRKSWFTLSVADMDPGSVAFLTPGSGIRDG